MHIGHVDAQALAASAAQEASDARAAAKSAATKRDLLLIARKLAAENAENPDFAVEDVTDEGEKESGDEDPSSGGSLNAKA